MQRWLRNPILTARAVGVVLLFARGISLAHREIGRLIRRVIGQPQQVPPSCKCAIIRRILKTPSHNIGAEAASQFFLKKPRQLSLRGAPVADGTGELTEKGTGKVGLYLEKANTEDIRCAGLEERE